MADKEYRDVDKHYKRSAAKAKADSTSAKEPPKRAWQSLAELQKLEAEYFKSHGKKAPSGTFKKAKPEKKGIFTGYKAMEKFSSEYWKQKELKKKIKKKKGEGAKIRAKKGS